MLMSIDAAQERKRRLLDALKHRPKPRLIDVRFSLRAGLVAITVLAVLFAAIGYYMQATTPRVKIVCEKPDAMLYFRDRFQGTMPVNYTEERAKGLVPNYNEKVRTWHRGFPSKERERDLIEILSDELTHPRGFWIAREPGDEQRYHYEETPWGLAIATNGAGGDSRGLHQSLARRNAASMAFIESWSLSDEPTPPGSTVVAQVKLGSKVDAETVEEDWTIRVSVTSYEERPRKRYFNAENPDLNRSGEDSSSIVVTFTAPEDAGRYAIRLRLEAKPADKRNNHFAEDVQMITVAQP